MTGVNRHRGEVSAVFGGRRYRLCLTLGARRRRLPLLRAGLSPTALDQPLGSSDDTQAALSRVPGELWMLITVGMGGYIIGRTGEKMVDRWSAR